MTFFEGLFLGLVQGLTEFLPISSSGHLVFFEQVFNIPSSVTFDLMLHFGTLLSILVFYRKDILNLFKPPFKTLGLLILATIPTVIGILIFRSAFESLFDGKFLAVSFFVTGIVLLISSRVSARAKKIQPITKSGAMFMGLFQTLAVIPGLSRSGMTISSGLLLGVDREEVSTFSFLMSIPIILGSIIVSFFEGFSVDVKLSVCVGGIIIAFLSGLIAIKLVVLVIKKMKLYWFSIYLFLIAAICLFVL